MSRHTMEREYTESARSQRDRLLVAFKAAGPEGLTDDEAAEAAGLLDGNYWQRCGELRSLGLIKKHGKRTGLFGYPRMVSIAV